MVGTRVGRAARRVLVLFVIFAVAAGAAWLGRRPVTVPLSSGPLALTTGAFVAGDEAPRSGVTSYLGIAPLRNTSSEPIHVDGVRITQASHNVRVVGYRQYSTDQFGGRFVTMYRADEPDVRIDVDHAQRLRLPYTIPPHASSNRFTIAEVRVVAFPPPGFAKGCLVTYRIGSSSHQYLQVLDCTFYFGADARDYFDRRTTLEVVNSYPGDVRLLGCPICKSKGVLIEGPLPQQAGSGHLIGWDLDGNDPRSVTVVVDGKRVSCRPPVGAAARVHAAMHGPDLTYDITRKGTCVVPP